MSDNRRTTLFSNSLVWFGAAVSIAEILTGTLFAPLGMKQGLLAILLGHLLGCLLLYGVGLVGGRTGRSSMEAVKLTFGEKMGAVFAGMNVIQLTGWTAVMIVSGAMASQKVFHLMAGPWIWAILIAVLILIWLSAGIGVQQKLNVMTMLLLFGLSLLLSKVVCGGGEHHVASQTALSFCGALELSVAMPVSWLPLIADYTCTATRPKTTCFASVVIYFVSSCWMYWIGMTAAIYTGKNDVAEIMAAAGLGLPAILIVILSTVTTTYLDVYSAGISLQSIWKKMPARPAAMIVCLMGLVVSLCFKVESFEGFLYWISSVFVPMATVHVMDQLLLRNEGQSRNGFIRHFCLWFIGFGVYRLFLFINLAIGSTLPTVGITVLLCLAVELIFRGKSLRNS